MRFILIGLLIGIITFITTSIKAQQDIEVEKRTYMKSLMCAKHDDLVGNLEQEHGEARKWWAVNSNDEVVELFVNNENGAWTIVITNNKKFSCALIGGDYSGANYDIDSSVEKE